MCSCYECKVCNKKYNVGYKYIHQKSKLHRTNQKLFDLQKESETEDAIEEEEDAVGDTVYG